MTAMEILPAVDGDAVEIGRLYQLGRHSMVESVKYLLEAGRRLIEKKTEVGHGNWLSWLAANADALGFDTPRTAQRLIDAAHSNATSTSHLDDTHALEISREIWGNNGGPVRGTAGTGDNEWFTPSEYVELARKVLGAIDLDPASHNVAQRTVRAAQFFTKSDDGLTKEWCGRVWLNPPYAQPLIADFTSKLLDEIRARRVKAAITLTHNYTDTIWFQSLAAEASAICFTRGRVRFEEPNGEIAAPTQGQAFCYFGRALARFADVFDPLGFVVIRRKKQ